MAHAPRLFAVPCLLLCCAACAATRPGTPGAQSAALFPPAAGAPAPGAPSASPGGATATAGAAPATFPRLPELTLDPKAPARPLPELKVENVGLHIGGGPNDAETKAPFLRAVAARFPAFMDCYRQNEDAGKGGTFGIDLHVARQGGKPEVSQPRTGMRGADFRGCVVKAFESVEFEKPKKGPTTLSYSLRYWLDDA